MLKSKAPLNRTHSVLRGLKYWIDTQECAWLLPWGGGNSQRERDIRNIRKQALRLHRKQNRENISSLVLVTRTLVWPIILIYRSWQSAGLIRNNGFLRRFTTGCRDLTLYNARSEFLRTIREQRPNQPKLARLYVTDRENQALLIHLNEGAPSTSLGDKIIFDQFCHHHRFAHIPLTAHSGTEPPESIEWPKNDLFVKASNLWGGQHAHALHYDPSSSKWQDQSGQQIAASELLSWVRRTYEGRPWLVQPMLTVDPTWSQWSPGPLGTVRIVTVIIEPGSTPEIIAASMRLPRAGMMVDNFSAGALSAEIDEHTGELRAALGHQLQERWHDTHPDTGGQINGACIPDWASYRELAINAHAAAADLTSIGWDLTCYHGRPALIEANPVYNLAPTVVLGETKWLEAMLERRKELTS